MVLNDFSLPFQNNSEGKKDISSPFLFKARTEISFFWSILSIAMIPLLS